MTGFHGLEGLLRVYDDLCTFMREVEHGMKTRGVGQLVQCSREENEPPPPTKVQTGLSSDWVSSARGKGVNCQSCWCSC